MDRTISHRRQRSGSVLQISTADSERYALEVYTAEFPYLQKVQTASVNTNFAPRNLRDFLSSQSASTP